MEMLKVTLKFRFSLGDEIIIIILVSLKQSYFTQYSIILEHQNTRNHSAWTIENGDPMHEGHTVYLVHGDIKCEARRRNRYKNNARVVRNLRKERGHEGEKFPYHRLD